MDRRLATTDDMPELFEMHRAVFRTHIEQIWGWDEDWQRTNFAAEFASSNTSVIEIEDRIVGYVQIRDEGHRIYLQNIALSPEFQRRGFGTRLLKRLQRESSARKVALELAVFRTNPNALKFYERIGFRRTGETSTHIEMSWRGI